MANSEKPRGENNRDHLAVEVGRIAKLLAMHMIRDVEDEGRKITRLNAVGFSNAEIAAMLDKTENNVRVQISQSKSGGSKKRSKN